MAQSDIGHRMARIRTARGISRTALATTLGRTPEWVKSVELGRRRLDRYSLIRAVADALEVDVAELLGHERPVTPLAPDVHHSIPALRRALMRARLGSAAVPVPLVELQARAACATQLRRHAHYARLAERLPALLDDLSATVAGGPDGDRDSALHLLASARHDAAMMARKLGLVDLGALAARDAHHAAVACGDPLLLAAIDRLRTEVLLCADAAVEARPLVDGALDQVEALLAGGGTDAWAAWGALHLAGATVSARLGHPRAAEAHLGAAAHAVPRAVGEAEFSAAHHAVHAVQVGLELGEGTAALARADGVDLTQLPLERQTRHGIARSWARLGARDEAGAMEELLRADLISSEGVRAHPVAREIVVVSGRRQRAGPAVEVAARFGIVI